MKLFLSGQPQVGKTTIIERIVEQLEIEVGGFLSWSTPFSEQGISEVYLQKVSYNLLDRSVENQIGRRVTGKGIECYPKTFDQAGISILAEAHRKDLLIFDELGYMENEAFLFQQRILELLNSPLPVLGVIKPVERCHSDFLMEIRRHPHFQEIVVTEENREHVVQDVLDYVQLVIPN